MRQAWLLAVWLAACGPVPVDGPDAGSPDAGVPVVEEPAQAAALADEAMGWARPWVEAGWVRGVSIGARAPDGVVFRGAGVAWPEGPVPDADTLFEIGSVTKTFTSTLLAEAVRRGETTLDTRLADRHPSVDWPAGAATMTLEHLSTHFSGLPRMPTNFAPADPVDPYVDYTSADLLDFLGGYTLPRAPGASAEYSNLGVGLLGWSLLRDHDGTFESLLRERVLDPLGLEDTRMVLDASQMQRFALGSDPEGRDVPAWNFDVLGPAGGLRSSARDLVRYLSAHLDPSENGLDASLRVTQQSRRALTRDLSIGLAWFVEDGVVWHDGAVGGMQSFVAFAPARGEVVVVLANTNCGGCGPLWAGLGGVLRPGVEPSVLPPEEVELTEAQLDRFVGDYRMSFGGTLYVTRSGTEVYARLSGQSRNRIHPVSEDRAVLRVVEAELEFVFDGSGPATAVVLHQDGASHDGERLPD